jgi:capsular exopolysaccharide synthesis family protein
MLIPMERHPAGYLVERPFSAYAEAFQVMRSTVRFSHPNRKHGVVAVTSSLPGEGKTTCALSLARIAALAGHSTILVDCDRRKRSLNDLLDLRPNVGLLEALEGRSSWQDVISASDPTGVHVLPCSMTDFTTRDSFGTDAMAKLVDELREHYDLVILDCPPVLVVAETLDIVSQADSVVMVGRAGTTPARAARAAIDQLRKSDARLVGLALNCVDPREQGSESYYGARFRTGSSSGYYA